MKDDETRSPPPPPPHAWRLFVSLTAILAAASIQPASADTWDVPFLGDRIQVKAHPDNQDATFTVSDHNGDSIDIPASSGCDTLPCGFDKPEDARFLTVESESPIFVISRTNQGRLLPAFRRSAEPPDCEARREADEVSIDMAQSSLNNLYVVRNNLLVDAEQRAEHEAVACSLWSKTLASARTSLAGCMVSEDRNRKVASLRNAPAARHCEPTDEGSRSPHIWNVPFIGQAVSIQTTPGTYTRKDSIRVIADNRNDAPLDVLDDCSSFPCGFTRPTGTKFLRIESDDPLFVAARSGDNATGRMFPVYRSAPDWQDCATRQADDRAFLEETAATIEFLQTVRQVWFSSFSSRNAANSAICRLAKDSLVLFETNLGGCPAWDGRSRLRTVFNSARLTTSGCYTPPTTTPTTTPTTAPPPATPAGFRFAEATLPGTTIRRSTTGVQIRFGDPIGGTAPYRYSYVFHPPRMVGGGIAQSVWSRSNDADSGLGTGQLSDIVTNVLITQPLGTLTISVIVTDANGDVAIRSTKITVTPHMPGG